MNLFSASWKMNKAQIEKEKQNFYKAIRRRNKEETLKSYQKIQMTFSEIPMSLANFIQKWTVNNYKKKTLAELKSVMNKKSWLKN